MVAGPPPALTGDVELGDIISVQPLSMARDIDAAFEIGLGKAAVGGALVADGLIRLMAAAGCAGLSRAAHSFCFRTRGPSH